MELELKYIWIKEFKTLENFEFNFCHSGEHVFSYDGSKITLHKNEDAPISFGTNVSSITAIVGKNGSGKSTFCELVLASVATLQNGSFSLNYFIEGIVCYANSIFVQKELEFENQDELEQLGYQIFKFDNSPFEAMLFEWRKTFVHDGFVYYSNYIDLREIQDENNLTNISTSALLQQDYFSPFPLQPIKGRFPLSSNQDNFSQFETYTVQENYRFLKFILEFPDITTFVREHINVSMDLSYSGNCKYLNISDHENRLQFNAYERGILSQIEDKGEPGVQKIVKVNQQQFKELSHQFYKLNLIIQAAVIGNLNIETRIIDEFLFENKIPEFIEGDVLNLLNVHMELLNSGHYVEEYSPFNYETYHESTNNWKFYVLQRIFVPFTSENRARIKRFMDLEEGVLNRSDSSERRISNYYINQSFSSGEASYLTLFSRIYDVIRKNIKGHDDRNKLILFIDEAEVGFHPEWSKSLIKRLLDFLNRPFNPYQIQLILTTHSPYLLSDLPKYNVRQFYKELGGHPKLLSPMEETFGSNIYDLLADSFYMENGFIGDFAQEKIDKCFSLLDKVESINSQEKLFIETIIEIVGEPLIKRQLVQLYDEKFSTNTELDFIDEQIERLKKLREDRSKE